MRAQSGQAILLVAVMITVLIGMVALAIDGARGYAMRRDLQSAVDAAALAAGDSFQRSYSYTTAEQAATTIFATNLRLYAAPGCSPSYGPPGPSPLTITCTYPDGTALTQVVSNLGPGGGVFRINASRQLQLDFASLLTDGASPTVSGTATGSVNNLLYAPALAALNPGGCGGTSGSAIAVNGTGTLTVTGDVVADGLVTVPTGALSVAGDVYVRCQATLPSSATTACYPSGAATPCTWPDIAGNVRQGSRFGDPGYPVPAVTGGSWGMPASNVVLSPGSYTSNPLIAAGRCYFLSGGVYAWRGGYKANGGFVSNELKPPDEPDPTNNLNVSAHQFWNTNGVNCAGSFKLTASSGSGWSVGNYGFEITSVRSDTYGGV
ncbi:MAG TPA: pilus assembly protein TadG-related protein, partial [Candidatus Udaeobacter sp.]|nr:pilus assembly protein TadG-related protein [Candidatus Udaeobacter sp.]